MSLNLESKITLDSASFERGMDRVKDSVFDSVKTFALAAIGVGSIEEALHKTIETAENFVNQSRRLDMTVEQVQVLTAAAKEAGKEFDNVAEAVLKINLARGKALAGDRGAVAGFRALGISTGQLSSASGGDLFQAIGEKVKSTNIEELVGPLKEVMGRGAGESIGILKSNFEELGEEMRKTGQLMDTDVAFQLKAIADEFEIVGRILTSLLAPVILETIKHLVEFGLHLAKLAGGTVGTAVGIQQQVGTMGLVKFLATGVAQNIGSILSGNGLVGRAQTRQLATSMGINTSALGEVKKAAEQPYIDALNQFEEFLNKSKEKKPKAADYKNAALFEEQKKERNESRRESDSLVKVGNFFGSNRGVLESVQARMERHAAMTASNTARTNVLLDKIVEKTGGDIKGKEKTSKANEIIWPEN